MSEAIDAALDVFFGGPWWRETSDAPYRRRQMRKAIQAAGFEIPDEFQPDRSAALSGPEPEPTS